MFRLLQGDVGSGKTIVSLISALNVIESNFQVAFMAPTEILARQHFNLAKQLFPKNIKIKLLSSKSDNLEKKKIIQELKNHKIEIVFGTHAIFQKKIKRITKAKLSHYTCPIISMSMSNSINYISNLRGYNIHGGDEGGRTP